MISSSKQAGAFKAGSQTGRSWVDTSDVRVQLPVDVCANQGVLRMAFSAAAVLVKPVAFASAAPYLPPT